jgi:hypothetical protein
MTMLTHRQQKARLARHIAAFIRHQQAATAALREVTAIALCETDGNPLTSALRGEDAIAGYIGEAHPLGDVIDDAKAALDCSGHVI